MSTLEPSSDEPTILPGAPRIAGPESSVTANAPPSSRFSWFGPLKFASVTSARSSVLPGDLRAGGIAVDLIEQVPGVRMAGAERGGVHFAPAQLQVHRRARLVIGRDRTTANRLIDEGGRIEPEDLLVGGKSGQGVET